MDHVAQCLQPVSYMGLACRSNRRANPPGHRHGYGNQLYSVLDDQNNKKDCQHRIYIVHVRSLKHDELLGDEDVEHWHRSFLPNTTLDTGEPRLVYSYHHAISGFAARLTSEEVRTMESIEGFLMARPSRKQKLSTTYTPSGITPDHASFMDDGTMPPKPPKWKGSCRFRNKTLCNNKLIGAIAFRGSRRPSPKDSRKDGHGTHVAGIAAGSFVDNADVLGLAKGTASGTAPKAHLAIYRACTSKTCDDADIVAAIEEAIKNGVDILSLSLGQESIPFYDDDTLIAALSAVRAKIFVCMAAGNLGPRLKSVENGAPWILTVGASTHDRRASATVRLGNGVEVEGESGYQPSTFNAAGNIIFPGFRGQNGTLGCKKDSFNNIDIKGKIVLCSIEIGKFRDMSINVKEAGGVGMIVLDTFVQGSTTFSDDYVLPTAHVNYTEAWKISGTSMATPHLAGIAALLKNTHKNWSVAAIRSAIMTTADRFDLDGDPIFHDYDLQKDHANTTDMGSGQVNPIAANDPGLIYDINHDHYIQYLCGLGYNDTQVSIVAGSSVKCSIVGSIAPEDLNYPSISIYLDPLKTKSVKRTITNVGDANELYNIDVEEPNGIRVVVSPSPIQFSRIGEEKSISLEFSSNGMALNQGSILDGQLKLDSGKHFVRSPISVTIL
ncbi:subtilisin-like protease 4 [Dioscorea cayenensis subsp. rotundata]|uniref:Subtilisin-like protease 4 n=1 Tax=Dioscorea cayennensis subsp. rotundata TaxID=55577 RepID=A0AB40C7I7_DIOCR|nr:subtilisin-like protease 4 [Dioscorea cayenensis subsp. rotundata]